MESFYEQLLEARQLKESFNDSFPDWLKKFLGGSKYFRGRSRAQDAHSRGPLSNIDFKRARYVADTVPTSPRDPRIKDPNKIKVWRFNNGAVVIPGYNHDSSLYFGKDDRFNRTFANSSFKDIISNAQDFGYIDLTDNSNLSTALKKKRDSNKPEERHPQYKSDYDGKWNTVSIHGHRYDKSGYLIDPQRLINKLRELKASKGYESALEDAYNKLIDLRSRIKGAMDVDPSEEPTQDVRAAYQAYFDACKNYRRIYEKIENYNSLLNDGEISRDSYEKSLKNIFDAEWGFEYKNLDQNIRSAEEYLKRKPW